MRKPAVGIVGGGLMGSGIATKFALAGCETVVVEPAEARLSNIRGVARDILSEMASADILSEEQVDSALSVLRVTSEIDELASADIVVESIPEILEAKQTLFSQLEGILRPDSIIASNTSGFSPDALSLKMKHEKRFMVSHFWNPPHLIPLVEVVPGSKTDQRNIDRLVRILCEIGAEPVVLKVAIPGFIGNRLQFALLREALNIVQMGAATPDMVDAVMKASLGRRYHIMGPLEAADLGGLGTFLSIADHLMPELAKDQNSLNLLREHLERGAGGIGAGRGFYLWNSARLEKLKMLRRRQLAELSRGST
jgi:3-hydroxybutyryl-CoA dehydrogenase